MELAWLPYPKTIDYKKIAMSGETDLNKMLEQLSPSLVEDTFVFCTVNGEFSDYATLSPKGSFVEEEGLTLILSQQSADSAGIAYDSVMRMITLSIHSSLDAVGLTAAVSAKLTEHDISANVVAAFYHDHIFVPAEKAELAVSVLSTLAGQTS